MEETQNHEVQDYSVHEGRCDDTTARHVPATCLSTFTPVDVEPRHILDNDASLPLPPSDVNRGRGSRVRGAVVGNDLATTRVGSATGNALGCHTQEMVAPTLRVVACMQTNLAEALELSEPTISDKSYRGV